MISIERLLGIPCVDTEFSFDVSPDGRTATFSWNISGRWEIYRLALDYSSNPKLLLPGPGSRFNPKFSPVDPNLIACVADFDGSEDLHLLLLDIENGTSLDLTPGDTLQPSFSWSPDGRQIAFINNRSGCFDVYSVDLETRRDRLVCSQAHTAFAVSWSPGGDWLAVTFEAELQEYNTCLVRAADGEMFQLQDGDRRLFARNSCWSPDGKRIVLCATVGDYYQLGVFDITTRRITWLSDDPGDKSMPVWHPGGNLLVYLQEHGATNQVVLQNITGQDPKSIIKHLSGFYTCPRFSLDGHNLVFIFENPQNPPDLWSYSLGKQELHQLTHSLPAGIDKADLPMPVEIRYPGLDDGIQIPALLFTPVKTPAPAIVNIHGGPNWHYSMAWNPYMTHFASRGWIVLAPNYRGSTGYGRIWQVANQHDMGGCDTRDVAAGAHYLVNQGLVDPRRIAVTGRSHGGYLTMTCLTQYPELWVAGSGIVPFFNWFTSHYASREDLQHWNIVTMGDPIENERLWHERSPYFFLDKILVPVQIICSGLDPRCPAVDSIAARDRLLELGKELEFHLYPDEGHTFLKMKNIIGSEIQRIAFLQRWLESAQT